MDIEDVRRRLLLSIAGSFAVGCGPMVQPDGGNDDGIGSTTGTAASDATSGIGTTASHDSSPSDSATTEPPPESSSSGSADAPDPPEILDFGEPVPTECVPQPMPPVQECGAALPEQHPDAYFMFHCVGLPEAVSCEEWAEGFDVRSSWVIIDCIEDGCTGPYAIEIGCGPLPDLGEQCCFWFAVQDEQICPGRPFVVAGRERLAALVERDDWMADPALAPLAPHPAIAAAWAEQAAFEHASIASFSRFVLQLLACGAPARLVAAAQVALGEEIEHARLFFGFASRFAGHPVGPGPLSVHDALVDADDFDAVVLSAVREGCIAAWHVAIAAQAARDPAMARALARVAEQELEHAALAWSFLAWALPRASGALRARIDATFHDAERFVPRGPALADSFGADQWLAHGILPAQVHAAATRHALRELVAPVADTLMRAVPARAEAPVASSTASLRA